MPFEPAATVSPEGSQLQRILESRTFRASAIYRDLLAYLAKKSLAGEADDLKEYTVGVDALGKPPSYDPRQDSSVRMCGGRLRQKLADYYRLEGVNDPVLIDLPKGGFRLTFETRSIYAPQSGRKSIPMPWVAALAAVALVAIAVAVYNQVRFERLKKTPAGKPLTPELRAVWEPLLSNGRPLALCLSVPIFANFSGLDNVIGPFPADWNALSNSPEFANVKSRVHADSASPSYEFTDVATATGAFRLGQFLEGRTPNILLTRSDLMTGPELAMDNLVFVGSPAGNPQLQGLATERQFVFGPDGIRNLHPDPGEPPVLPFTGAENGFPATHALITLAPSANGNGLLMYLTGRTEAGIVAAVEAVTNPAVAQKIFSKLTDVNGRLPRYYQVVITARSMEEMPIDISYAAHRSLAGLPSSAQPAK